MCTCRSHGCWTRVFNQKYSNLSFSVFFFLFFFYFYPITLHGQIWLFKTEKWINSLENLVLCLIKDECMFAISFFEFVVQKILNI